MNIVVISGICAFLSGIVTAIMGYGWVGNDGFNPKGAIVNVCVVLIISIILWAATAKE